MATTATRSDRWGHPVATASADCIAAIDAFYDQFLNHGRNRAVILQAPHSDPNCVLANTLAAYFVASKDPSAASWFLSAAASSLVSLLSLLNLIWFWFCLNLGVLEGLLCLFLCELRTMALCMRNWFLHRFLAWLGSLEMKRRQLLGTSRYHFSAIILKYTSLSTLNIVDVTFIAYNKPQVPPSTWLTMIIL